MCEYSAKLVAWLDRELDDMDMAAVEIHVRTCPTCATSASKYRWMSRAIDEYLAIHPMPVGNKRSSWVPAISVIAAAAMFGIIIWISFRPDTAHVAPQSTAMTSTARPPTIPVERAKPALERKAHSRHAVSHRPAVSKPVRWLPPEPAFQVAIPAESMFPPGAVPDGVTFIADVSLGADGSPQQIRLQPRLLRF